MKRFISLLLTLTLLLPVSAMAQPIADVGDTETLSHIRFLQNAGVFDAEYPNGRFRPNDTLTRAEFCRMAVSAAGVTDLAFHRTYTVFPDIRAANWALPYVNAAVRELGIVTGRPDGTFGPGNAITFGEAATILIRLLGYTDDDVGANWPRSYLNRAEEIGITAGMTHLPHRSVITRAQAAAMFYKTLNSPVKGGGKIYIETLGAKWLESVLVLHAANGVIHTADGSFAALTTDSIIPGRRGDLLVDANNRVLRFRASSQTIADMTVSVSLPGELQFAGGTTARISAGTPLYFNERVMTYGTGWANITASTTVTIAYTNTGAIDYIWAAAPPVIFVIDRIVDAVLTDMSAHTVTLWQISQTPLVLRLSAALSGEMLNSPFLFAVDTDNTVFAVRPSSSVTVQTVLAERADATRITLDGAGTLTVNADTPVLRNGVSEAWSAVQPSVAPFTPMIICRDDKGLLLYIIIGSADDNNIETAVIKDEITAGGNPLRAIFRDLPAHVRIVKNGADAQLSDLRRYDVCVLNRSSGTVTVSDNRITGALTDVSPSLRYADEITVGNTKLAVVPSAAELFTHLTLGQQYTYLLTDDNKVAGVVAPSVLRASMIGIAVDNGIELTNGITLTGTLTTGIEPGDLVTCTAINVNSLSMTALRTTQGNAVDVFARKMGSADILPHCVVYERAGPGSRYIKIPFSGISVASVPAAQVRHATFDSAGRVNLLVLEDVTGDSYDYGQVVSVRDGIALIAGAGGETRPYTLPFGFQWTHLRGHVVGVASRHDGSIVKTISCSAATGIRPADFDLKNKYVRMGNQWIKIAVDAVFIPSMSRAVELERGIASAHSFTVYYDRDPALGGKVRMIIGE
jgi:hypothetical protein